MTATVADLCADLFATVLAFRTAGNAERPPYRVFRQEVLDLIGDFDRRAERARVDQNGDVRFALVALIDETVMSSDWDDASEWARNPLQMQYYGDFTAGDRFFERLERLQAGADDDLLSVYFTCLCAGFRGKYRDDPAALMSIRNRLFQRLSVPDMRDEAHLTSEAYGRQLERPLMTRRFPLLWLLPVAAAVVGLYVAFYVVLDRQAHDIGERATAPKGARAAGE